MGSAAEVPDLRAVRASALVEDIRRASETKWRAHEAWQRASADSERVRTEALMFALRHSGTPESEAVYRALEVPAGVRR